MLRKVLGSITLLLLPIFFLITPALAVTINPAHRIMTIDRGTSQVVPLTIKNDDKSPHQYGLGVMTAKEDSAGRPQFITNGSDAEGWVKPESASVNVAAGKTRTVYFTVAVPNITAPGVGHYVGLVVDELNSSVGIGITPRLVSLLEIQVAGVVKESGVLSSWVPLKTFSSDPTWQMQFAFFNSGNAAIPLKANVTAQTFWGSTEDTQKLSLGSTLLPGTSRNLTLPLSINSSHLLPGLVNLKLTLNYGLTNQAITSSAWVWYFPPYLQFILALIVVIIVAELIRTRLKKIKSHPSNYV